jgi:phospho-N-acetylmuramoyl-pentapeptide-transferase
MIYLLLKALAANASLLNIFHYITLRSVGALLTALIASLVGMPALIRLMHRHQRGGQPIRTDGPEGHIAKQGTPTMGGIMILATTIISTLLWYDGSNHYIPLVLFVMIGFGALGFADDFLKVTKRNTKGVRGRTKLMIQSLLAVTAMVWCQALLPEHLVNQLAVPFLKNVLFCLGWFYLVFGLLVIVGASNAVNLTDGLDGLAIMPVIIAASCFALISYAVGHVVFAEYLKLHYIPDTGELAVFCGAMIGAGFGFLWYNAKPAQIMMGDTGSLALGGAIGMISVITKHEFVLGIIGGLFVIEALSVILQVYYFKWSGGKRIFRMAPIHHHFEKCGWSETTIVIRFWIIALVFALLGLATLKIR